MRSSTGNDRYDSLMLALHEALRRGDVDRAARVDITVKTLLESTVQRAHVEPLARETLESVRRCYVEAIEAGVELRDQAAVEAARGRQERVAAGAYRTMGSVPAK